MNDLSDSESSTSTPPLAEVGPGDNVLVLAPGRSAADRRACHQLSAIDGERETDFLAVSFTRSPMEWVEEWDSDVGRSRPARAAFVTTAETLVDHERLSDVFGDRYQVLSVSDPGDLTGIGMRTTSLLGDQNERDNQLVVCLDSITTILQFAEPRRTFQFLHTMTNFLARKDAISHYHMDPEAHEKQTVAQMRQLFDEVVAVDE